MSRRAPSSPELVPAVAAPADVEAALRQQRQELQIILDAVPAMIWYKDRDNRILRANRLAAASVGLTATAIEGRSTYDLYPEDAERYFEDDREVIASGQPKLGIVEPLHVGGERRWIRTDKVPYRDASGAVVGVIVFAVDITDRVLAEEALREARDGLERRVEERTGQLAETVIRLRAEIAERVRAEERIQRQQAQLAHLQRLRTVESLAAQLAHEINQPLGAIVNFASGLARRLQAGGADPEPLARATEEIRQQALRAAAVVRRLRQLARKGESAREPCRLGDVIGAAVGLVETEARHRGVALRVAVGAEVPAVTIDRTQIEQVVVNLLHNAIEALARVGTADGGEVRVEAILGGDGQAEVRVHDNGPGLPAGDARELFEPFFTTKADGLGMGLPISHSIVAAHGGRLAVELRPGPGATFVFTLPAAAPE